LRCTLSAISLSQGFVFDRLVSCPGGFESQVEAGSGYSSSAVLGIVSGVFVVPIVSWFGATPVVGDPFVSFTPWDIVAPDLGGSIQVPSGGLFTA
jgi:hypothetical protein